MNQTQLVPMIVIGLFLLPVILIIFAAILKSLKGKVHFELPRPHTYRTGEKVNGTLVITTKKDVTADRITVWLRCFHRNRKNSSVNVSGGHKHQRRSSGPSKIVHFETSMVLAERVPLRGGMPSKYSFELQLPQEIMIPTINFPENVPFGKAMNSLIKVGMKSQLNQLHWELSADAEMAGLDLNGKTPLNVDVPAKIVSE